MVETTEARPAGLEMLFELERMILRRGKRSDADRLSGHPGAIAPSPRCNADVIVDFTGAARDPGTALQNAICDRCSTAGQEKTLRWRLSWRETCRSSRSSMRSTERCWIAAILPRRSQLVSAAALETVMARTLSMLAAVLSDAPRIVPQLKYSAAGRAQPRPANMSCRGLAVFDREGNLSCSAATHRIGTLDGATLRRVSGRRGICPGRAGMCLAIRASVFRRSISGSVAGTHLRLFRGPRPSCRQGHHFRDRVRWQGPVGGVVPVLEEPWHLSYPFLIEDGGDLWMIPESTGHRDVALCKCVRFPDKWERHATLLSGPELADVTITQHNGLNYMFGASRDRTGGYSDTLSIFYSGSLFGPWLPHENNPVLMDRASTRPAGNFVRIDGKAVAACPGLHEWIWLCARACRGFSNCRR